MYSNKANINLLTAHLIAHDIRDIVVCPGSRNAPIVHNLYEAGSKFQLHPITDERSAAFVAIGLWIKKNPVTYVIARTLGYTVEKPQLFYIDLPKVFGLSDSTSDSTFVSKAESGIILEFTKGKDYALKLTEQEIKSIDERYWQFAVPVEGGE